MGKNILKRGFVLPRDLKNDKMYLNHGYNTHCALTKVSIHFETKSCMFYVYVVQFPEYIIKETKLFLNNYASKKGNEDDSKLTIRARDVISLEKKINDWFLAYRKEYSNINLTKKIAVEFRNNLSSDYGLNIGINYVIYIQKEYLNEVGEVIDVVNLKLNQNHILESKIDNMKCEIYDYTDELEGELKALQKKMNMNMSTFIKTITNDIGKLNDLKLLKFESL